MDCAAGRLSRRQGPANRYDMQAGAGPSLRQAARQDARAARAPYLIGAYADHARRRRDGVACAGHVHAEGRQPRA
jgi:cytochrome c1